MSGSDTITWVLFAALIANTLSGLIVQAILFRKAAVSRRRGWVAQFARVRRVWTEPLGQSVTVLRLQAIVKTQQALQVGLFVSTVVAMFLR